MLKTSVLWLALLAACASHPPKDDCVDADGDGYTTCDGDCDDNNPLVNPGANEVCGDGIDNNCDGVADEACNGIGTFVSAITGADTNPGTTAAPLKTIGAGIANAVTLGNAQSVTVAEGVYGEKVTLVENVDLLGGFQCDATSCTWARDPVAHVSEIDNPDFEGVVATTGITQATLVEGFTIVGKDGAPPAPPGSAGVTLSGGSPTLRDNTITGGNLLATGGVPGADRSIAVAVLATTDAMGAVIDHNTLTGGTSPAGQSIGVMIDRASGPSATSLAAITNNVIRSSAAHRSVGVVANTSVAGTLVANNTITAGSSNGGASIGIEVSATLAIDANRINTDAAHVGTCTAAPSWCSGIASSSSTSTITNNVVYGPKAPLSTAVFLTEAEVAGGTVIVNGNTLNGGGTEGTAVGSLSESAAIVFSIGNCNVCGLAGTVGRIRNNILDGGINLARFGLREDPSPGRVIRPEVIENNAFWFSVSSAQRDDVLLRQVNTQGFSIDIRTIAALNALVMPPSKANIEADPLLDPTWHLRPSSPCQNAGTATEAPPKDIDGDPRPSGSAVDIGADEAP